MPVLKQVLPKRYFESSVGRARIDDYLDVAVVDVKLNTGSPCSGHDAMFANWPGDHQYVRQWFILENGMAVAVNENPTGEWEFPIVEYGAE